MTTPDGEYVECDACGGSGRGFGAYEEAATGQCIWCGGKGDTWSVYVPEGDDEDDDPRPDAGEET